MRLTIINQFYRPDLSPTANLSASLANYCAAQGHEVTVITSRGGYVTIDDVADDGKTQPGVPRVIRLWTPRFGKSTLVKRCIDYLCFYCGAAYSMAVLPQQDVIVSLTTPPYIAWTGVVHKLIHRHVKLVLWNMDCYPDVAERAGLIRKGGLLSRVLRGLNRALLQHTDVLICLDQAMKHLMYSQYAANSQSPPVTVIPNWEEAQTFPPVQHQDVQGSDFIVIYMGNLGTGHSFDTALDVATKLKGSRIKFLFRGGGSRWHALKQAVKERQLDNVSVGGYVGEKQNTRIAMGSAACALITLRDDALGVMSPSKLHASLAMGLPVVYIGPPGSNVDDAITRYGCGASIRNGDVDSLVQYLTRLANDAAEHSRTRIQARQAFLNAYSDLVTLPRFEALLSRAAASVSAS